MRISSHSASRRRRSHSSRMMKPGRMSDKFGPVTTTRVLFSDISLVSTTKVYLQQQLNQSVFPNNGAGHTTITSATLFTPPKSHNPVSSPLTPVYPHRFSAESQHIHPDATDSGILGSPAIHPRLVGSHERGWPTSGSVQETSGEEEGGGRFGDESARVSEAIGRRTERVGRND